MINRKASGLPEIKKRPAANPNIYQQCILINEHNFSSEAKDKLAELMSGKSNCGLTGRNVYYSKDNLRINS